ncbi:MAG: beta-glucosidase [Clostridiales bacterium]|nr:beta-glucosidase [Clostridiales bacterium]
MEAAKLEQILNTLTLEEKASLCSGLNSWETKPLPAKGVPSVFMADGPTGLRKEDLAHTQQNGGPSVRATCFPTEATIACAWDEQLTMQVGSAIGAECRANGVTTLLAPGVNMKRSPLCGRNFEYYAEDPLLAGKLAVGFIKGLQQQGVGCSLKHFAANSQETLRMSVSSEIDERALHEIYLRAFEIAVKQAAPSTLMCSYNKINGCYSADNHELLTEILRDKWGFDGLVMSDWGAVHDRVAGVRAGLDLEMPSSYGVTDRLIVQAVQSGTLTVQELDTAVRRVLRFVFDCAQNSEIVPCDLKANHQLAVTAAAQSAVLLKNNGVLPLGAQQKVLFVGEMAQAPRYQGGGSSIVNANAPVAPLAAAKAQGYAVTFAQGWRSEDETPNEELIKQAVQAAQQADTVVLFLGLTEIDETEGRDRRHLSLPQPQLALAKALCAEGKPLVVVLIGGSPVELPWLGQVDALLNLYLAGEGVGEAACDLLWGKQNPCGKLAETWPLALAQTPSYLHYPMGPNYVSYNESIFIGYRYYDTVGKEVLFPFGYGLSYTSYKYSDLQVESSGTGSVTIRFTVTNTGNRAGAEVCQCYVHPKTPVAFMASQTLAAFQKVTLPAGESKHIELVLEDDAFAFYSVAEHKFVVSAGEYEICVGTSSRALPLCATVTRQGTMQLPLPQSQLATGYYGSISGNEFPDDEFAKLHPLPENKNIATKPGDFALDSTLGELRATWLGRQVWKIAFQIGVRTNHFVKSPKVNREIVRQMTAELPVKNIALMSNGLADFELTTALLDVCNGKGGKRRLLHQLHLALSRYRAQKKQPKT